MDKRVVADWGARTPAAGWSLRTSRERPFLHWPEKLPVSRLNTMETFPEYSRKIRRGTQGSPRNIGLLNSVV